MGGASDRMNQNLAAARLGSDSPVRHPPPAMNILIRHNALGLLETVHLLYALKYAENYQTKTNLHA